MENKQNSSLKNEVQSPETLVQHDESGMFTTSLIVAQAFGKDHKNVLQAIENLECSPEFHRLNFQLSSYTAQTGNGTVREYPAHQLPVTVSPSWQWASRGRRRRHGKRSFWQPSMRWSAP
ncbi:Rha family transcriptional regulator [Desulfovibrio falkowii]|uniref:Rha family transcriptional regulator n=1 Tax=Desulfovibrio falkowii TaxID=3136602 RepID=UPI0038B3F327